MYYNFPNGLFRVRNKQETIYCYSEAEKQAAIKKIGNKPEITRFKGLGEISPDEFHSWVREQWSQLETGYEKLKSTCTEIVQQYTTYSQRDFALAIKAVAMASSCQIPSDFVFVLK